MSTDEYRDMKEFENRMQKLNDLKNGGEITYKSSFKRTHLISEIKESMVDSEVSVCGRLTSKRKMGKLIFADIYAIDGTIQLSLSREAIPEDFALFKEKVDLGDFIGVSGTVIITKTGQLTVSCSKVTLLTKALQPLPEKFHGIVNSDTKYRQRYLDVISNEESRQIFIKRFQIMKDIREFLYSKNFIEVETPILQDVASGAVAKPFTTKQNALDKEYFLRISPELYLKRTIACGFDRVFEMGKNFRNEDMDPSHLQEFTMIEWYCAYWSFEDNIVLLEELIRYLVNSLNGNYKVTYQGEEYDFGTLAKFNYTEEINKIIGCDVLQIEDPEELKKILLDKGIAPAEDLKDIVSLNTCIDYVFKRKIRPNIKNPTIVYNYPACMVPLARRNDENPKLIDMFQLIVNGWEMVKAYSELVDPLIQREAFVQQMKDRAKGDEEAMAIDEDYLLCMEHGFPPISGLGMGIDRLVAFLTDQPNLRDVILFPMVK